MAALLYIATWHHCTGQNVVLRPPASQGIVSRGRKTKRHCLRQLLSSHSLCRTHLYMIAMVDKLSNAYSKDNKRIAAVPENACSFPFPPLPSLPCSLQQQTQTLEPRLLQAVCAVVRDLGMSAASCWAWSTKSVVCRQVTKQEDSSCLGETTARL